MIVKINFIEPLLGTTPGNKEIAQDYIVSKHPDGQSQEEIDSIPEVMEKTSTYFPRTDDGIPFIWDYQWKGFFKEACMAMIMTGTHKKEELKNLRLSEYTYKRSIDKLIFINPRRCILQNVDLNKITMFERPLRKENFKGGNVALCRSEMIPAGATQNIEIISLNKDLNDYIKLWLDYGCLSGMLQWRNASYGRFEYEILNNGK